MDKKISDIRDSSASADDPVSADTEASRMFDFNSISLENLLTIIKEATSKQCSVDLFPTSLLKDSAKTFDPYIIRIVNRSLSLGYFAAGWKHVIASLLKS